MAEVALTERDVTTELVGGISRDEVYRICAALCFGFAGSIAAVVTAAVWWWSYAEDANWWASGSSRLPIFSLSNPDITVLSVWAFGALLMLLACPICLRRPHLAVAFVAVAAIGGFAVTPTVSSSDVPALPFWALALVWLTAVLPLIFGALLLLWPTGSGVSAEQAVRADKPRLPR